MIQWLVRRQVAKALAAVDPIVAGRPTEWRAAVQLAGLSGSIAQVVGVGALVALRDELIFSLGTPSRIVRIPITSITSVRADQTFAIKGKARWSSRVRFVIVDWDEDGASRTIVFGAHNAEELRARLEAVRALAG